MIDKVNDEFIVNCTNNSKEERQQVYKFLVGKRSYSQSYLYNDAPIIVCNKKPGDSNWLFLENYYNWFNSKKDLPIYTFEQFKEMYLEEEFVLPEKWCVKVTDKTHKTISENSYRIFPNYETYITSMLLSSKSWNSWDLNRDAIKEGYTEITFEQFKKYVLKQETMEKEIIGYKLIKHEYSDAAREIVDLDLPLTVDRITPKTKTGNSTVMYDRLKKAGVLDLWFEPVYAASEQTVSMNGKFNLTIKGKKVFHQNEDITSFVESVGEDWEHKIKNFSYNNYAFNVKDVILSKTGCQSQETYLSNWLKVYDLIK